MKLIDGGCGERSGDYTTALPFQKSFTGRSIPYDYCSNCYTPGNDSILSEYEAGDYGEATLDEGEKRLTVRNRLKAAAGRRNLGIEFRRTNGDLIRFKIAAHRDGNGAPVELPTVVSSEPPAPAKRKGGRPKKVVEQQEPAPAKRKGGRPKQQPA